MIEFLTLDGVMRDPDGAEGTEQGGWMFRFGPGPVEGDKFKLGPLLDTATLLLGRRTWEHFAGFWPTRSDDFSNKMNAMRKQVVSRSLASADSWNNSSLLAGDLVDEVARRKATEDIVVTGSASVVRTLMAHGLIDEYRLIVFPVLLGQGTRLFDEAPPATFDLVSVESAGPAVRLVYRRPVAGAATSKEEAWWSTPCSSTRSPGPMTGSATRNAKPSSASTGPCATTRGSWRAPPSTRWRL